MNTPVSSNQFTEEVTRSQLHSILPGPYYIAIVGDESLFSRIKCGIGLNIAKNQERFKSATSPMFELETCDILEIADPDWTPACLTRDMGHREETKIGVCELCEDSYIRKVPIDADGVEDGRFQTDKFILTKVLTAKEFIQQLNAREILQFLETHEHSSWPRQLFDNTLFLDRDFRLEVRERFHL